MTILRKICFSVVGVTVGGLLVAYLLKKTKKKSNYRRPSQNEIILVTNHEEWDSAWNKLYPDLQTFPVLGFDCEWVTVGNKRNPISMVQLTSLSGLCILVRTHLLMADKGSFPQTFKDVLSDKRILKIGVAALEDAEKLTGDFCLRCFGYVDLRNFVLRCTKLKFQPAGLKRMAWDVLGVEMDKDYKVRCGNWECKELNDKQLMYAALDSHISLSIFLHLLKWNFDVRPSIKNGTNLKSSVLATCQGIVDLKFRSFEKQNNHMNRQTSYKTPSTKDLKQTKAYETRKAPLYHGSKLYSREGELLCTCDVKKARWYLDKNLAEKVSDDPLCVRLLFEPSGKPSSHRDYYLQEKENVCVVCGKPDSYMRKFIIPHEYKRHLPAISKEHKSHDVVLMCVQCHLLSDRMDASVKANLAEKYDARIRCDKYISQTREVGKVKSAAQALIKDEKVKKLPPVRAVELENILKEFFKVDEVTEDILRRGIEVSNERQENKEYEEHGWKVMQAVLKEGSLMEFETMWRQHFLDFMQPGYMPLQWSVNHGHDKMKLYENGDENIDEELIIDN